MGNPANEPSSPPAAHKRKTTTSADAQTSRKASAKEPPPPMRSTYPSPPEGPPMTKAELQAEQGMSSRLNRPTAREVAKPFYEWADPKVGDYPFSPLPKGWTFEHMS